MNEIVNEDFESKPDVSESNEQDVVIPNQEIEILDQESAPVKSENDKPAIRAYPVVAWCLIVLCCCFLIANVVAFRQREQAKGFTKANLLQPTIVGKLLAAFKENPKSFLMDDEQLLEMADELNQGPVEQRLCSAILINEIVGHEKALERLEVVRQAATDAQLEYNQKQTQLEDVLQRLFNDYGADEWAAPSVTLTERLFIEEELGWLGKLVLNPEGRFPPDERTALLEQARQLTMGAGAFAMAFVASLIIGGGLLVLALLLLFTGQLRSRVASHSRFGGIYVETFACWLILFIVAGFLFRGIPVVGSVLFPIVAIGFPMLALGWPALRGVPWLALRDEIGFRIGNPVKEVAMGFLAYLCLVPILALGALIFFLASAASAGADQKDSFAAEAVSHPVVNEAVSDNYLLAMFSIFMTAVVLAPLVEELMFRGFLYQHLRAASGRWSLAASITFSAVFNSLVFAAIHPQGLAGIPALMGLAIGFSLTREWRGTIIAPMVMHAMNNFSVTVMLALAAS